jgi:hypothetical protein
MRTRLLSIMAASLTAVKCLALMFALSSAPNAYACDVSWTSDNMSYCMSQGYADCMNSCPGNPNALFSGGSNLCACGCGC